MSGGQSRGRCGDNSWLQQGRGDSSNISRCSVFSYKWLNPILIQAKEKKKEPHPQQNSKKPPPNRTKTTKNLKANKQTNKKHPSTQKILPKNILLKSESAWQTFGPVPKVKRRLPACTHSRKQGSRHSTTAPGSKLFSCLDSRCWEKPCRLRASPGTSTNTSIHSCTTLTLAVASALSKCPSHKEAGSNTPAVLGEAAVLSQHPALTAPSPHPKGTQGTLPWGLHWGAVPKANEHHPSPTLQSRTGTGGGPKAQLVSGEVAAAAHSTAWVTEQHCKRFRSEIRKTWNENFVS